MLKSIAVDLIEGGAIKARLGLEADEEGIGKFYRVRAMAFMACSVFGNCSPPLGKPGDVATDREARMPNLIRGV